MKRMFTDLERLGPNVQVHFPDLRPQFPRAVTE
jgi:hypothetical protein